MHLALVISSLGSGGAERVISELANHWAQQGHIISLITFASPDTRPFYPLDPQINLLQLGLENLEKSSLLGRMKNILRRFFSLRKTLHQIKPDRILSFMDITNITVLLAGQGLKIPIIVSERTDPNDQYIPKLYQWLRLKTYSKAKKIVVQTESAAAYFPKNFKDLITIIPNIIKNPTIQKTTYSKEVKRIITVGRLSAEKDHKALIEAFFNLLKLYPDLQLTIYGEGSQRRSLEDYIFSLNLQNKVFLPGTTSNVQEALVDGDLFIFPSKYEGFPNALGEAMAVGLPVIASDCAGNRALVQDSINGRLFPVGDVNALTQFASQVIIDHEQRKRLATNAKKVTSQFRADRILNLWDEVVR